MCKTRSSMHVTSYFWKPLQCTKCKKAYTLELNYNGSKRTLLDYEIPDKFSDFIIFELVSTQNYKIIHVININSRDPIFRKSDFEFNIGAHEDNDIQINSNSVCQTHAKISLIDGMFYLSDLGSKHGTYVYFKDPIEITKSRPILLVIKNNLIRVKFDERKS
jgi:hypothetical protein